MPTRSDGEIEVRLAGEQTLLDEQLLHADVGIGAVRAGAHVDGDQSVLAGDGVVDVELGRDLEFEIHRLEAGAAAEQIEAETEILLDANCSPRPKKSNSPGSAELATEGTGIRRLSAVVSLTPVNGEEKAASEIG